MAAPADLAYLCVDRFLDTPLHARALATAFELGLVDRLATAGGVARAALQAELRADAAGLDLLLDVLAAGGVVGADRDGGWGLTEGFASALRFRDLLEAKLALIAVGVPDILGRFTELVADPGAFAGGAGMFRLFDYTRALEPAGAGLEWTRRWVRITTALTKYEAAVCLRHHDFSACRRLVDVGGNSGEFARRVCAAHPGVAATVVDLAAVCAIGRDHLRGTAEAARVEFVEADALTSPLPAGADIVSFKSMLHDWPEQHAAALLSRAFDALVPGGTVLIFERAKMDLRQGPLPYSNLPMLTFARWLRDPAAYVERLTAIGFGSIAVRTIALETPFSLVTAIKPRQRAAV